MSLMKKVDRPIRAEEMHERNAAKRLEQKYKRDDDVNRCALTVLDEINKALPIEVNFYDVRIPSQLAWDVRNLLEKWGYGTCINLSRG
jgi:hypothetical protein